MALFINEYCTRDCERTPTLFDDSDYFELYNSSSDSLNISGFTITIDDVSGEIPVDDNGGHIIPAGGWLVVRADQPALLWNNSNRIGDLTQGPYSTGRVLDFNKSLGSSRVITITDTDGNSALSEYDENADNNIVPADNYSYTAHPCVNNSGLVFSRQWDGGPWPGFVTRNTWSFKWRRT